MSMKSHSAVVSAFERGDTGVESNSMETRDGGDGWTVLMGYGHAPYAARAPDGRIVRFDGWAFQAISGTGWRSARNYAGSTTTKSNHWPELRGVGTTRVAYTQARTDMERGLKREADIVTDDGRTAAPGDAVEAIEAAREVLD